MIEILETRIAPAALTTVFQFANQPDVADVIATDDVGNIFIAGKFFGNFVITPGANGVSLNTSDPAGDLYIAKFTPDGKLSWLRDVSGVGPETLGAIAVDSAGDLYVTGSFDAPTGGFGGSGAATAAGHPELFVVKRSGSDGTGVSGFGNSGVVQFGSTNGSAEGTSLAFDQTGLLLVGGTFSGTGANINSATAGLVNADNRDGVVLRIDPVMGLEDASFGSAGAAVVSLSAGADDSVFRVAVDAANDVFVGVRSQVLSPGVPEVLAVMKLLTETGTPDTGFASGGQLGFSAGDSVSGDFALDQNGGILAAAANGSSVILARFDAAGNSDVAFGLGGVQIINLSAKSAMLQLDQFGRIYLGGATATGDYLGRLTSGGSLDGTFVAGGVSKFGNHTDGAKPSAGFALDAAGHLVFRDSYEGKPDLDPSGGVKKIAARTNPGGPGMTEGFIARIDVDGISAGQSLVFESLIGDDNLLRKVIVTLSGPGVVRVLPKGESSSPGNEIGTIELTGTTLASILTVTGQNFLSDESIYKILTLGTEQHMGAILINPRIALGDGGDDDVPDLVVTGRTNALVLGDLRENAYIKLGEHLPYDLPGNKTPDTYNNRPALSVRDVLGAGVVIENIGDGTPLGIGGGGFGNIVFNSWAFDGVLRTTQSIGNFTIKTGDFYGVLEIDKFGNGDGTTANTGMMSVQNGSWGSSGTEIEGNMGGFDAEAFLAGASITAGSSGPVTTGSGDFAGTLTLTDAGASKLPTFTVASDFTGTVISLAALKKLKVKGDFKGTLIAPSIGGITALSFIGDGAVTDPYGDADKFNITAEDGLLGKIKSKSGVIRNYEFDAPNAPFSGLTVNLINLTASTIGIENVVINAQKIGPISVTLAASKSAGAINLTGISNSQFTAAPGSASAIASLTVKVNGGGGSTTGLEDVHMEADVIGDVKVTANAGKAGASSGAAVNTVEIIAANSIGKVSIDGAATSAHASGLLLWSGGKIKSLTITSSAAEFGSLESSSVLAGQSLTFTGAVTAGDFYARLAGALLGPVTLSGSLVNSQLVGGADIAKVTVGGDVSGASILAGTMLGGDRTLGGGDDDFVRASRIGAAKVNGSFSTSILAAGINPTNGTFGDGDDLLAAATGPLADLSRIGPVTLSTGVFITSAPALSYTSAILAAEIASIIVKGQPPLLGSGITGNTVLDFATDGADASDLLISLIAP